MAIRLIDSLGTTEALAEVFSDNSVLQAMINFEIALARAEAQLKIIPADAAKAIAQACRASGLDSALLARDAAASATPAVPFVKALTDLVRENAPGAAGFVHWGATSQDVCDTALVLLLKKAQPFLGSDLRRVETALRRLAQEHRGTVKLSRTLLQPGVPTTFGLTAAGWLAAIHRCRKRLDEAFSEAFVLQFGGAGGTLAALEDRGLEVGELMARELDLNLPDAPWHVHRDRLAALVCACGVLCGALGKMARDISLLMQHGIGEVSEPGGPGRGGSSTMPHKQNPVGCAIALAAANRLPGLASSFLACMTQEHERAIGGWQAEWPVVVSAVQATGACAAAMAEVAEGLIVVAPRMRANLESTQGVIFAERAVMLGRRIGFDAARKLLAVATRKSVEQNRRLIDVLREMPDIRDHIDPGDLRDLENPEHYLGVADEFRKRLLAATEESSVSKPRRKKE